MKTRKEFVADFEASEMDAVLLRWLLDGVRADEKDAFEKTLLFNKRFREHFCEWIKAIREPAWALQNGKQGE